MEKKRITLTRDGRDKMCSELEYLKGAKRRENAKSLAEARAHGDLSENAEYDAAKEAQAMNEKRISELEDILIRAQLIDENIPKDKAFIGTSVRVQDLESGEEFVYMLVDEEESDYDLNKISVSSPVGKAILGHKVDDVIEIKAPAGVIRYKIVGIS